MPKKKRTDEEKQAFIDLHFEEYKRELYELNKPINMQEWEGLNLDKKHKRVNDWLRRKNVKNQKTANGLFDELQRVNYLTALELLTLKGDVCALIDRVINEKIEKEKTDLENKLAKFDDVTKLEIMRAKENVETARKEEKRRLQEQLAKLQNW